MTIWGNSIKKGFDRGMVWRESRAARHRGGARHQDAGLRRFRDRRFQRCGRTGDQTRRRGQPLDQVPADKREVSARRGKPLRPFVYETWNSGAFGGISASATATRCLQCCVGVHRVDHPTRSGMTVSATILVIMDMDGAVDPGVASPSRGRHSNHSRSANAGITAARSKAGSMKPIDGRTTL